MAGFALGIESEGNYKAFEKDPLGHLERDHGAAPPAVARLPGFDVTTMGSTNNEWKVFDITALASDFGGLPLKVRVEMATYEPTRLRVKELYGFVSKDCWIAHVLELNGQTPRIAHNRIDPRERKVPCPPNKREPIERVLREFGKI